MARKQQSSLLIYLIALMGLVLGFLYNSQTDPAADIPPISSRFQLSALRGLEDIRIDFSLLQSDQLQSLRVFGQLPVQVPQGGKADPFR